MQIRLEIGTLLCKKQGYARRKVIYQTEKRKTKKKGVGEEGKIATLKFILGESPPHNIGEPQIVVLSLLEPHPRASYGERDRTPYHQQDVGAQAVKAQPLTQSSEKKNAGEALVPQMG